MYNACSPLSSHWSPHYAVHYGIADCDKYVFVSDYQRECTMSAIYKDIPLYMAEVTWVASQMGDNAPNFLYNLYYAFCSCVNFFHSYKAAYKI